MTLQSALITTLQFLLICILKVTFSYNITELIFSDLKNMKELESYTHHQEPSMEDVFVEFHTHFFFLSVMLISLP